MTRPLPAALSRIFHYNTPYRRGNSAAGARLAKAKGYKYADIDGQISKDGIPIAAHWHRFDWDGFTHWINPKTGRLEKHPYKAGELYRHLTYAQICQLRDKTGNDSVASVANLAEYMAEIGVNMNLEVKDDPRYGTQEIATRVLLAAHGAARAHPKSGFHIRMMTLSNLGDAKARLKAFHSVGFQTIVLARSPIPVSWEPYIDYVRGRWSRQKGR